MKDLMGQMPWVAPIIISLLIGAFQVYGLIDRVDALEETGRTRGDAAIQQLQDVDHRVSRVEELCCGEQDSYKEYLRIPKRTE